MKIDNTPLTFGKYKGITPSYLAETDPSYLIWAYRNVKPIPCSPALAADALRLLHQRYDRTKLSPQRKSELAGLSCDWDEMDEWGMGGPFF